MADLSDLSVFLKMVKNLKFIWESKLEDLWKLPVTRQIINFLILLIKLIPSLPSPLGFKCNAHLLSSFEVKFPLLMISICKPYKYSFILITITESLLLSVRVIKLEMTTLLSGKVFSIISLDQAIYQAPRWTLKMYYYIIRAFFNNGLI